MKSYQEITLAPENVIYNPQYFLYQIESSTASLLYLKTTKEVLSSAAFIDGRSQLSTDQTIYRVGIFDALKLYKNEVNTQQVNRYIFHLSFCGSTLLAKACATPNKVFSYKEPQVLIDLAALKAENHMYFTDKKIWKMLVALVNQQLQKTWHDNEVAIIKPSNWVNNILPDLLSTSERSRAVFMVMSPRQYLIAVLRGGRERIAFTYKLLAHLLKEEPEYKSVLMNIEKLTGDVMHQVARTILITYSLQYSLLGKAKSKMKTEQSLILDFQQLLADPRDSMQKTAEVLALDMRADEIAHNIIEVFSHHSKSEDIKYNIHLENEINAKVVKEFSAVIKSAMTWYEQNMVQSDMRATQLS